MHTLSLVGDAPSTRRVLAIGAHSDDIEIGCGATMLELSARGSVEITWVVFGASGAREQEAKASAAAFVGEEGEPSLECHGFRDGFYPYEGAQIKEVFEDLKARVQPDLIFTHARNDLHQDHRLLNELTWNTWRDHLILEYEVPKYDGDLGVPNVYVPVDRERAERKVRLIVDLFPTQRDKHWFGEELFLGLMRLRGAESRSPSGYAEAFYGRKLSVRVTGAT